MNLPLTMAKVGFSVVVLIYIHAYFINILYFKIVGGDEKIHFSQAKNRSLSPTKADNSRLLRLVIYIHKFRICMVGDP